MTGDEPRPPIEVAPEVADALRARRAVVALETAVLTHGLPRTPMAAPGGIAGWDASKPANLALSMLLESTVRAAGAVIRAHQCKPDEKALARPAPLQ